MWKINELKNNTKEYTLNANRLLAIHWHWVDAHIMGSISIVVINGNRRNHHTLFGKWTKRTLIGVYHSHYRFNTLSLFEIKTKQICGKIAKNAINKALVMSARSAAWNTRINIESFAIPETLLRV